MHIRKSWFAALALVAVSALVVGCGGSDSGSSSSGGDITVGTSLPLTGPLAPFGPLIEAGYKQAVEEVNKAGGLEVEGEKRKVDLVIQDNASDPNKVSEQSRTLVLKEGAVGLLTPPTPPLSIPASNVAESLKVPAIVVATPEQAWLASNPKGWNYAWDIFFDEDEMTDLQFKTSDLVKTNKKVALFTDNEQDGVAMGELWEAKAPKFGYEIAYHAEFPVGTTDYSSFISEAQSSGAEILIAQMIPPDAFALWKQMKSVGFQPQLAFCEKCAASNAWQAELGPLSEGTLVASYWNPENGKSSEQLVAANKGKFEGLDLSAVAASFTSAKVLLDAIERADSTDPEAINEAVAETDGEYPLGHVTFNDENRYPVEVNEVQWQGPGVKQVYKPDGNKLLAPVPGLG